MNKENYVFENKVNEKRSVNVSICKCNIKSKKNTYYGRVCKTGRVENEELLAHLKKVAPYIDINMMRAGLEGLKDVIVELVSSGKDVDFLGLGTFSLASEGKIEVNPAMQSYLDDGECEEKENADFDVSEAIIESPKFNLKFEPSSACKNTFKAVKMAFAIKKRRSPVIKKIENAVPFSQTSSVSIIRLIGENLKIAGDKKEIGMYMREESGAEIKIDNANIIQNTPKTLLILLNETLKNDASYTLSILTQYVPMGSSCTTSILRGDETTFIWNEKKKNTGCSDEEASLVQDLEQLHGSSKKSKSSKNNKKLQVNKSKKGEVLSLAA